jgi:integrase
VLRYQRRGKVVEIGLGGADRVTLARARKLRDQHMDDLEAGLDPREEKRKQAAASQNRKTFAEVAAELIKARRKSKQWRANANDGRTSSLDEWTKHLTVDCKRIASRAVAEIESHDIEPIVQPSWDKGRAATTRRLLKRIEAVFAYAKAKRWRTTDNPATWAIFEHLLQGDGRTGPKSHHPALGWVETPAFVARLRSMGEPTMAALALEMMILTACRSGEVRGMRWEEIDVETATWNVPAERMKRKLEHEVPLSTDALALLKRLEAARINRFVFPGRSNTKPIAHWAVWGLVQRLTGREEGQPSAASPHGFRSSFRSWCRAKRVPDDIAERALAHAREDATQAAYDREEMLPARREVMEKWASFLSGKDADNVVPMKRGVA